MSSAIELGNPNSTVELAPVYVRGQAYLALGESERAAAEFQEFVDHRGLVGNFPWGATARLGLARAYALEAHFAHGPDVPALAKARGAYKNFSRSGRTLTQSFLP